MQITEKKLVQVKPTYLHVYKQELGEDKGHTCSVSKPELKKIRRKLNP